jgi:hypothetical protein
METFFSGFKWPHFILPPIALVLSKSGFLTFKMLFQILTKRKYFQKMLIFTIKFN